MRIIYIRLRLINDGVDIECREARLGVGDTDLLLNIRTHFQSSIYPLDYLNVEGPSLHCVIPGNLDCAFSAGCFQVYGQSECSVSASPKKGGPPILNQNNFPYLRNEPTQQFNSSDHRLMLDDNTTVS